MLTEEEIREESIICENSGEAPLWCSGFREGARWANEQNAVEIAELKDKIADLEDKIYNLKIKLERNSE